MANSNSDSNFLNVQKAAAYLGVNPSTIRKWAQANKLHGEKLGSRGDWRFHTEDLSQMIHTKTDELLSNRDSKIKKQLYRIFMEAPVPIAILKGPHHVYELSNPQNNAAIGVADPVGRSVKELFPNSPEILNILNTVYTTGVPFYSDEYPLEISTSNGNKQTVYVKATYQPLRDDKDNIIGIMTTGIDITQNVLSRMKVEENEQRLVSMFESVTDGFVLYDNDWRYVYINKKAAEMAGANSEDLIGKTIFELYPDRVDSPAFKEFQRVKNSGLPHQFEYFSPGTNRWINANLYPSKVGLTAFLSDITEMRKVKEDQKFLEDASIILSTSIDYQTTLTNIAKLIIPYLADYCRIVVIGEGNKIEEIAVHHVRPEKLELVKQLYDQYRDRTGATHGVDRLLESRNSEIIEKITPDILAGIKNSPELVKIIQELGLQSYMGVPMKIGNKIVGAITLSSTNPDRIYTNSDLRLAEELAHRVAYAVENSLLYSAAQKAISLRDEFISVASHELKTPVTSLKIYAQYLQKQFEKTPSTKQNNQYVQKMNAQIDKLVLLISDLLNISRLQAGKFDLHKEIFDMNILIEEIVDVLQPTTSKHKIIQHGNLQSKVRGDRSRLGLVVSNLVNNAIKYSPKPGQIFITLRENKKNIIIQVTDSGIGISKEDQKKIFSRFYRVNTTKSDPYPGLGLGLYISDEIVRRHGGKMFVKSEKDAGSIIGFELPLVINK